MKSDKIKRTYKYIAFNFYPKWVTLHFTLCISWESNPWSCGLALLWVTGTTGERFVCVQFVVEFITRYQIRGNHPLLLCHLSFPSLSTQVYSWVHFLVVMDLSFRTKIMSCYPATFCSEFFQSL